MIVLAAFVLGWQRPPPDDVMKALVDHYHKLRSFSAKIQHHGDFMSDTRNSTDTLFWLAPKRFEITSDSTSSPKLFSDGKKLTTFVPLIRPISEDLQVEGRISTWENRGGFLLSLLMKSQLAEQLLHPGKPLKIRFVYGDTLKWHDVPVSEIKAVLNALGTMERVSYFLSPDYKQLLGMEVTNGNQSAWTQYTDAVENAAVPKTLGDMPTNGG